MAGELFGAPAGTSQAIQDSNVLSQMSARNFAVDEQQQMLPGQLLLQQGEIAKIPAQIDLAKAHARLFQAQATKFEEQVKQDQLFGQELSKMAQEGGMAGKDPIEMGIEVNKRLINASMVAGNTNQMQKYTKDYVDLVTQQQKMVHEKRMAEQAERTNKISAYTDIAHRVSAIELLPEEQRPAEFAKLNDYFQQTYKEPPPWGNTPYSPELANGIRGLALTEVQKANIEGKQEALDARKQADEAKSNLTQTLRNVQQERLKWQKEKEELKTKTGAAAFEPKKESINNILDMMEADDPNNVSKENLPAAKSYARDVATLAHKIRINTGAEPGQAEAQAYQQMKDQFKPIEGTAKEGILGFGKKGPKMSYKPMGLGTRDNPIRITPGMKGEEGHWYMDANGRVGVVKNGRVELAQ